MECLWFASSNCFPSSNSAENFCGSLFLMKADSLALKQSQISITLCMLHIAHLLFVLEIMSEVYGMRHSSETKKYLLHSSLINCCQKMFLDGSSLQLQKQIIAGIKWL